MVSYVHQGLGRPAHLGPRAAGSVTVNVKMLIEELMRQTTVTIGQLATISGIRAPLSHVADQVFLELAGELENQGVSKKVAADMFGLALRSYQLKVQRLSESTTVRKRSLWEAIFNFIMEQDGGVVSRAEVLGRFHRDDDASVRGILNDLVESNLVFVTGRGDSMSYRAVAPLEFERLVSQDDPHDRAWRVWAWVYWQGGATLEELGEELGLEPGQVEEAIEHLMREGRVASEPGQQGQEVYTSRLLVVPAGESSAGWETALLAHIRALYTAMQVKLREASAPTYPVDVLGGSTYYFDVWPGHPHRGEVMGLLRQNREAMSRLRHLVTQYDEEHGVPERGAERVTFYFGQSVVAESTGEVQGEEQE